MINEEKNAPRLQQVRDGYTEILKKSQSGPGCCSTSTEGSYYSAEEVSSLPPMDMTIGSKTSGRVALLPAEA